MKKRAFLKSTIFKWIISLSLFISITVIVISVSLYNWYSVEDLKSYCKLNVSNLQNTSRTIEMIDKSIKSVGFQTVNDSDCISMMSSDSYNLQIQGVMQTKLMNMLFNNPTTYSAYLVNKKASWIIGSPSEDWLSADDYSKQVNDMIRDQRQDAIIRINTYNTKISDQNTNEESNKDNIISYVFFSTRESAADDSFLIINVKLSELNKYLKNSGAIAGSSLFVTDKTGKVVFSQAAGQLGKNYGKEGYIKRIMSSREPTGFFQNSSGSNGSMVTYVTSDELKLTFISITPNMIVQKAFIPLKCKTIVLSILILFLGIAAAVLISIYFYSPLRRLLNKYIHSVENNRGGLIRYTNEFEMLDVFIEGNTNRADTLGNFVNENLPIVKQNLLKNILEGNIHIDSDLSKKRFSDVGISFLCEYCRVICFNIEKVESLNLETIDLPAVKRSLCVKIGEAFKPVCICETILEMSKESVVALLNYNENSLAMDDQIKSVCILVKEHMLEECAVDLTAVIGKCSKNDACSSYQNAVELLRYKLKYGDGSLIDEEKVLNDISGYDLYPENEEKYLLQSLRSLSLENSIKYIRQIVGLFYYYSINDIVRAEDHILYSTFQAVKEMVKNMDATGKFDFFDSYEKLMKYNSLQAIEENLISLYTSIIQQLNTKTNNDVSQNYIIKKVLEIIKHDYQNSQISIEQIAERVNMNPTYLGKIFKEKVGVHFTEYVNDARLEKAKELLTDTDENVALISCEVGFNSTAYFVTCFKKHLGVTPARFREIGRKHAMANTPDSTDEIKEPL